MGLNKTKKLEPDKKAIEWAVLFGINIILIIGIIITKASMSGFQWFILIASTLLSFCFMMFFTLIDVFRTIKR